MAEQPIPAIVEQWADEIQAVAERIGPRFARSEPRRRAVGYLQGLLSNLEHKNGWQLAEHLGEATPDGVQHLLARADWDADALRDDLTAYVREYLSNLVIGGVSVSSTNHRFRFDFATGPGGFSTAENVLENLRDSLKQLRSPVIVVWDGGGHHKRSGDLGVPVVEPPAVARDVAALNTGVQPDGESLIVVKVQQAGQLRAGGRRSPE